MSCLTQRLIKAKYDFVLSSFRFSCCFLLFFCQRYYCFINPPTTSHYIISSTCIFSEKQYIALWSFGGHQPRNCWPAKKKFSCLVWPFHLIAPWMVYRQADARSRLHDGPVTGLGDPPLPVLDFKWPGLVLSFCSLITVDNLIHKCSLSPIWRMRSWAGWIFWYVIAISQEHSFQVKLQTFWVDDALNTNISQFPVVPFQWYLKTVKVELIWMIWRIHGYIRLVLLCNKP